MNPMQLVCLGRGLTSKQQFRLVGVGLSNSFGRESTSPQQLLFD
jgi:hypothetical protein